MASAGTISRKRKHIGNIGKQFGFKNGSVDKTEDVVIDFETTQHGGEPKKKRFHPVCDLDSTKLKHGRVNNDQYIHDINAVPNDALIQDRSASEETNSDLIKSVNTDFAVENSELLKPKSNVTLERGDSGYSSDDFNETLEESSDVLDESDVLIPNDPSLSISREQPQAIDRRSSWYRLSGDSPVENHLFRYGDLNKHSRLFGLVKNSAGAYTETEVRIVHENQDSPLGDEFGVTLKTYETFTDGEQIRQHFFVKVEPKGPADQMRIKNNDELVLLNDIFAPGVSHRELIQLFKNVKVDGKTRTCLVIRRIVSDRQTRKGSRASSPRTWEWIETSAILAPDFKQILNDQPLVEKVHFRELKSQKVINEQQKCYKTNRRHLFLDISEGKLTASINQSSTLDRSKIIVKHTCYSQDPKTGNLVYHSALSDVDKVYYIHMDKDNSVSLQKQPDWFTISPTEGNSEYDRAGAIGDQVVFKKNGKFLAYDEEHGRFAAVHGVYRFEEVGTDLGFDAPDGGLDKQIGFRAHGVCCAPIRPNLQLSLTTVKRHAQLKPANSLDSMDCSSQDSSPTEMVADEYDGNMFFAQPVTSYTKTPTTPMMGLFINK